MSFGLLLPGALLALAALLLPLLLHLVRQTDRKRVDFAALRWLGVRAQPRRKPRIDEWLLLLLRLLLLALLALWLAQPVWFGQADARPWLLVHPAIGASRAPQPEAPDEQRRWLAPGFPPLEQPAPVGPVAVASLLREVDATLSVDAPLRVLVPAQFDATDAERPQLRRKVAWTAVPGTSAIADMEPPRAIRIAVRADPSDRAALPYVRAAVAAWAAGARPAAVPATLRDMTTGATPAARDTHLLWLAATRVPGSVTEWVKSGGVALLAHDAKVDAMDWSNASVAWRGEDGAPLARRLQAGNGAWVQLLVPFNAQSLPALLEPEFPRRLQELLAIQPETATRASAESYSPGSGATAAYPPAPRPIGAWLAWLIVLLFAIERWLAASPRRIRA